MVLGPPSLAPTGAAPLTPRLTPLPGGPYPLCSCPLSPTLQCHHTRCYRPQWQPPPRPARGVARAVPGDPRAACRSEPASTGRSSLATARPVGPVPPAGGFLEDEPEEGFGGTSSLCGLLLAFRHLQRPRGDSGRGDAPGKQDVGRASGRRNAEGGGDPGMLPASLGCPGTRGVPWDGLGRPPRTTELGSWAGG